VIVVAACEDVAWTLPTLTDGTTSSAATANAIRVFFICELLDELEDVLHGFLMVPSRVIRHHIKPGGRQISLRLQVVFLAWFSFLPDRHRRLHAAEEDAARAG